MSQRKSWCHIHNEKWCDDDAKNPALIKLWCVYFRAPKYIILYMVHRPLVPNTAIARHISKAQASWQVHSNGIYDKNRRLTFEVTGFLFFIHLVLMGVPHAIGLRHTEFLKWMLFDGMAALLSDLLIVKMLSSIWMTSWWFVIYFKFLFVLSFIIRNYDKSVWKWWGLKEWHFRAYKSCFTSSQPPY